MRKERYDMGIRYKDLTVNQRINLKAMIQTDPALQPIHLAWVTFGFVKAIDYLFSDDISIFGVDMGNPFGGML